MENNVNNLWESYQKVCLSIVDLPEAVDEFSIVTAYNPASKIYTDEQNQRLDQLLQVEILNNRWPHCRSECMAPDGRWREPGWAVACCLEDARALASRFGQNALYYIADDKLYLEPVLLQGAERVYLGKRQTLLRTRP